VARVRVQTNLKLIDTTWTPGIVDRVVKRYGHRIRAGTASFDLKHITGSRERILIARRQHKPEIVWPAKERWAGSVSTDSNTIGAGWLEMQESAYSLGWAVDAIS